MKRSNANPAIIGEKYNRLTVIGFERMNPPHRGWKWRVRCECGNVKLVYPRDVRVGKVKSCGCLLSQTSKEKATKFKCGVGENPRLYRIYNHVKGRCLKPTHKRYKDYGARGITICAEWLESFDKFVEWSNANGYADDLTLERIDVNGNYCPENCKWIELKEQAKNKRDTIWLEVDGNKVRLIDLAEKSVVQYDTLHDRIMKRGWDVKAAMNTPSAREQKTFKQMCEERGLKPDTVASRVRRHGWDLDRALNTPVKSAYGRR